MTHTIFVSVSEFLQNGGILDSDRVIYNDQHCPIGYYKETHGEIIEIQCSNCSYQSLSNIVFVKINVTPIYK